MVTEAVNLQTEESRSNDVTKTLNLPGNEKGNRKYLVEFASFHLLNMFHQEQNTLKPTANMSWDDDWYGVLMIGDRHFNQLDPNSDSFIFPMDLRMDKVSYSRVNLRKMINTVPHGTMAFNFSSDSESEHIKQVRVSLEKLWKKYFQNFSFDHIINYPKNQDGFFHRIPELKEPFVKWVAKKLDLSVEYVKQRLGDITPTVEFDIDISPYKGSKDTITGKLKYDMFSDIINLSHISLSIETFRSDLVHLVASYLFSFYNCTVLFRSDFKGLRKLLGDKLYNVKSGIDNYFENELHYNLRRDGDSRVELPELESCVNAILNEPYSHIVRNVEECIKEEFVNELYALRNFRLSEMKDNLKGTFILISPNSYNDVGHPVFNYVELALDVSTYECNDRFSHPEPRWRMSTLGSIWATDKEHYTNSLMNWGLSIARSKPRGRALVFDCQDILKEMRELLYMNHIQEDKVFDVIHLTKNKMKNDKVYYDLFTLTNITGQIMLKKKVSDKLEDRSDLLSRIEKLEKELEAK